MNILIDILHPAHVHFFKHIYANLVHEHKIVVTARSKDVCIDLLNETGIPYERISEAETRPVHLMKELLTRSIKLDRRVRENESDLLMGISGISIAPIGKIRNVPSFVFTDTENTGLASAISLRLASRIITPECFSLDLGSNHVRYKGYQELAYLHPDYFKPDPNQLRLNGLKENEPFFFVRFTSFDASHDLNQSGFSTEEKIQLARFLADKGRIVISSEGRLPAELEDFRMTGPVNSVHDLLSYASLFVGDSQTMATEAGLLGTPAVRCNTLVGSQHGRGNFNELQQKYGLVYSYKSSKNAFTKVRSLLENPRLQEEWSERRSKLLEEKGDVVRQVCDYICAFLEGQN